MQKILFILVFILFSVLTEKATGVLPVVKENKYSASINIELRETLIAFAKNYLGTPYRYASIDPVKGFDCSGFVHFVFKNFDIELPHSSKAFKSIGTELNPDDFKVGDVLVFYGYRDASQLGHVGIICEANGMKSKFIHSSSGKVKGVIISELDSDMYSRRFYKCVDVIEGK